MSPFKENIIAACLAILAVIGITMTLYILKPVLIPFVFAIFMFFIMEPLIEYQQSKLKFPRFLAVSTTVFVLGLIITLFSLMLGISVRGMIASSDIYQLKLIKLVDQLSVQALSYGYNIDVSLIKQSLIELPFLNWFKTFSGSLVGIIGNLILISIFVMFFMMGKNTSPSPKKGALMDTAVRRQITRYLTTKIFVSSLTAIIVGTVLSLFHVQLALMFATLTFFLNFIPNIGSLIATILPLPIMIVQFGFSGILIPIMILIASTQFTIGNIIEPRMMGKSLGLHPVVILLSLLFWGFIWGVPGMFLAVPMTAVLKLILERYPVTYSIAHLLEGDLSMASMIFSTSDDRQQLK